MNCQLGEESRNRIQHGTSNQYRCLHNIFIKKAS